VAATLERSAVHPIAKAIVSKAKEEELPFYQARDIEVIPGLGVQGVIEKDEKSLAAFIGDFEHAKGMLQERDARELERELFRLRNGGKLIAACVIDGNGFLISLSDTARPHMRQMLDSLKKSGHRIVMLTGDHEESARQIAAQVGIDEYEAELKPEDKLARIEALAKESGLAMCGDGINDAPALARATVGISMGQVGSQTAQAASDVILLRDNIELLDWLFLKAEKTRRIVLQNLVIATVAIVCGTIPALYGVLPLWLAVIVHEGGTVLVGLNALRLLR
jgi:Zn2+/Cd2+-exporting ATPase